MKKAGAYILIALGFVALFFLGTFVVMFFAPGVEIFGIKYLANGISEYRKTIVLPQSYVGDIYVDSQDVPITIQYTPGVSSVNFVQNFIGFTKSKAKQASLSVELDDDGNVHIKTDEIIKFLYANCDGDDYKLTINLSQSKGEQYKNIYVNAQNSNVRVISASGTQTGIVNEEFSVKTAGKLVVASSAPITTQKFTYHTTQKISISDFITPTSVDLKTENNDIEIKKSIEGSIVAKTNNGNIKFVSCDSLRATTSAGNIASYGAGSNEVKKGVTIKTRTGDITLGKVCFEDSSAVVDIDTASGDVSIAQMYNGQINNERGPVYVAIANALVVNNTIGSTKVDQINDKITVNGKNGKVVLGEGGQISNPFVETTSGAIYVKNASGIIKLESSSNLVSLDCVDTGVTKVDVSAGKSLKATDISGEVSIKVYGGDANVSFAAITGDVNINVKGSKSKSLVVDASCADINSVNYSSKSSKGNNTKVLEGGEIVKQGANVSSVAVAGRKNITINTEYATVTLKFAAKTQTA